MLRKIIYSCIAAMLLAIAGCAGTTKNEDNDMILTIYHYKVPCAGESIQLCFLVKKDNGEKEFFYDEITGFDYQWGYNYTISIEKTIKEKTMADASSFSYKLKKVLKKEKAPPGETFELPLKMDDQDLVENKKGACHYLGNIEIQTEKYSCEDLAKAESATFRHAGNRPGLVVVKIK